MEKTDYSEILSKLGKRPRTVLEHILDYGSVSTYELGQLGYDQPPRAVRDLRETGIKVSTKTGTHPITGHRMAIYYLDDDQPLTVTTGRNAFPKPFIKKLFEAFNYRCNICNTIYNTRMLQCDHRIPFLIQGEVDNLELERFQPLCAPHQRAKSWECEHCPNRTTANQYICSSCFWAIPDGKYTHVATRKEKIVTISFSEDEDLQVYSHYDKIAKEQNCSIEKVIKDKLKKMP